MTKEDKVIDFISEAGLLKLIKRSGWWVLGIKNPESVAEHSFRCAVLGYVLAKMEKADSSRVLMMALFNDMQEARINDSHKMAQRYIEYQKAEDKAFGEQISLLPNSMKDELSKMHKEYRSQKTKESIIARDADILECLIQAREYFEDGFKQAVKFMRKAPQHLKSKSAKRLWRLARAKDLNLWWESLSDFRR
ncbi:MAG: HD domain-containing protein [Candidatus Omnitrophica bacterium]|nr:HD domain-containing protein [Candidatus Omnitrophota bacterium]HOX54666.1 HD domain-containing protein [Candidatus Omnitrophota bacterium]